MMEILICKDVAEIAQFGDTWDRFSQREPRYVPGFGELRHALESSKPEFRIATVVEQSQIVGIACFLYRDAAKSYFFAEAKLFDLPVREASLYGSCVLGDVDESIISKILARVIAESKFDLLDLGFVVFDSPLYKTVSGLRGGILVSRSSKFADIQWLIDLPDSFDDYTQSLGPKTRSNTLREFRKLERNPSFKVRVIDRPEQVDGFLQDAERVSRHTYLWRLGARLVADEETKTRLVRLAQRGALRCYIAYVDGQPFAFRYGEGNGRIYLGRQVGFDPKYSGLSPGTGLMLWAIRDLIDNTDYKVFDFGVGGFFEYKTRFGNSSLNCVRVQLGYPYRPYSVFLIVLNRMLNATKDLLRGTLGRGKLLARLSRQRQKWQRRKDGGPEDGS